MSQHAIVYLDHHRARVFYLDGADKNLTVREATKRETDDRHQADGKRPSHDAFFRELAQSLHGAEEIIVVGPGTAKSEFKHHVEAHDAVVDQHIVAVETVDHLTEGQLLALARKRFKAIDQWL
jgi:stalled ribosome rescue protein Dom34